MAFFQLSKKESFDIRCIPLFARRYKSKYKWYTTYIKESLKSLFTAKKIQCLWVSNKKLGNC